MGSRVIVTAEEKWSALGYLALATPCGWAAIGSAALGALACYSSGGAGIKDFIAGGTSGAIAKTVAAPFEQKRLSDQLQGAADAVELAVVEGWRPSPRGGGLMSYWRGNGVNIAKYFPTRACNSALKNAIRRCAPKVDKKEEPGKFIAINMCSGAASGALSMLAVYPLDMAQTLLAVDTEGCYSGPLDCLTTVIAANGGGTAGISALYSGFFVGVLGMPIFRGFYFGVNDALRDSNPYQSERSLRGLASKFACAQAAAIAAGLAAYPFDTVRRVMQLHVAAGRPVTMSEAYASCGSLWGGCTSQVWRTVLSAVALVMYGELKQAFAASAEDDN